MVCQRICTKNVLSYVLYQRCSIVLASKVFSINEKICTLEKTIGINPVSKVFLRSELIVYFTLSLKRVCISVCFLCVN